MGVPLKFVTSHKHLGFWLTQDLKLDTHLDHVCRKVSSKLFLLKRMSCNLDDCCTSVKIHKSYIQPYFEYLAPVIAALNVGQVNRLEKPQRRAIRIIFKYAYHRSLTTLDYEVLGLTPLQHRHNFSLLCYDYKWLNDLLPRALIDARLHPIEGNARSNLRGRCIRIPNQPTIISRSFDRSPLNFTVKLLNRVPSLWSSPSIEAFKRSLWNMKDRSVFETQYWGACF